MPELNALFKTGPAAGQPTRTQRQPPEPATQAPAGPFSQVLQSVAPPEATQEGEADKPATPKAGAEASATAAATDKPSPTDADKPATDAADPTQAASLLIPDLLGQRDYGNPVPLPTTAADPALALAAGATAALVAGTPAAGSAIAPSSPAPAGRAGSALEARQGLAAALPTDTAALAARGTGKEAATAAGMAQTTAQAQTTSAGATNQAASQAAITASANDKPPAMQALLSLARGELMTEVAAQAPAGLRTAREEARGPGAPTGEHGLIGPTATPSLLTTEAAGSATSAPADAGAATAGGGQELSYWSTHGVHTGELRLHDDTLDAMNIRVRLAGSEAQVNFTTDQSQQRDWLAGSADRLQDLLGQSGITLTQVSVGTSGSQDKAAADANAQAQAAAGQARTARVGTAAGTDSATPARRNAGPGRVDMFV